MANVTHPLVLIDDVHINTPGILNYFHQFLKPGDYIIVEDTCPNSPACSNFLDENCEYENLVPENYMK